MTSPSEEPQTEEGGSEKRTPKKVSTIIAAAILITGSLVVSLLLAEIAARVYLIGPLALLPQYGESIFPICDSKVIEPSPYPGIPYTLKPNLDTLFKLVPLRTNSDGLRDKEYSVAKPPGVYRIAIMGDSFSLPSGVPIEKAWHSIMEDDLNNGTASSSKDKKYEVISFATDGYGLEEYVATLEHRALKYKPDQVIVGICAFNDLPMLWRRKWPDPYVVRIAPNMYYRIYLLSLVKQATVNLLPMVDESLDPSQNRQAKWSQDQVDMICLNKSFDRMVELSKEHGFKLTVVVLRRADEGKFQTGVFAEAAEKRGIPLIDCGPSFPDAGKQWWIYPSDGHPNIKANEVFAKTIEKAIQLD